MIVYDGKKPELVKLESLVLEMSAKDKIRYLKHDIYSNGELLYRSYVTIGDNRYIELAKRLANGILYCPKEDYEKFYGGRK